MADLEFTIGGNLEQLRATVKEARSEFEGLRSFVESELRGSIRGLTSDFTNLGATSGSVGRSFSDLASHIRTSTAAISEASTSVDNYMKRMGSLMATHNTIRERQGPFASPEQIYAAQQELFGGINRSLRNVGGTAEGGDRGGSMAAASTADAYMRLNTALISTHNTVKQMHGPFASQEQITGALQAAARRLNETFANVGSSAQGGVRGIDSITAALSRGVSTADDYINKMRTAMSTHNDVREVQGPFATPNQIAQANQEQASWVGRRRGWNDANNAAPNPGALDYQREYLQLIEQEGTAVNRATGESERAVNSKQRLARGLLEASRGAEDAAVSFGFGGWAGALRASINNISQLALVISPMAGAVAGFAGALVASAIPALTASSNAAKDAKEDIEKLRFSLEDFNEMQLSQARRPLSDREKEGISAASAESRRLDTEWSITQNEQRQKNRKDELEANTVGLVVNEGAGGIWDTLRGRSVPAAARSSVGATLTEEGVWQFQDMVQNAPINSRGVPVDQFQSWANQFGGAEFISDEVREKFLAYQEETFRARIEREGLDTRLREDTQLESDATIREQNVAEGKAAEEAFKRWNKEIEETNKNQSRLKDLLGGIMNETGEAQEYSQQYRSRMKEIAELTESGVISADEASVLEKGVELAEAEDNLARTERFIPPTRQQRSRTGDLESIESMYNRIFSAAAKGPEQDPVKEAIDRHREEQREQQRIAQQKREELLEEQRRHNTNLEDIKTRLEGGVPGTVGP